MTDAASTNLNLASNDAVLKEQTGTTLRLTMNRPESRNALSEEMLDALTDAFRDAGQDKSVHVIVLAAAGEVFCAGHNLKEMTLHRADEDRGHAYFADIMKRCSTMMMEIVNCPKPVIAEVQGMATAAGCQLVATCDLAIAADQAEFCTPGVNIGLFCSTPMVAVSRNIPRKQMMEMLLTGEVIDAISAKGYGLVNRVVPKQYLRTVIDKYASELAAKSPLTLKFGKEAFYRQLDMSLQEAYDYCSQVMTENMMARDAEEGINAFLQKRTPEWTGE